MESDLILVDRGGIHEIYFDSISEWFYSTDAKDQKKKRADKNYDKKCANNQSHI